MTTTETVPGSELAARVEQLIHEGTVRLITIKHEAHYAVIADCIDKRMT
jgi:hypothetical protein